ncbi:MAG: hypothetical protein FJ309_07885 [Planctomycetes bacterium]|nr:hypothetical protein [Planctomycetota bacterium]
MHGTSVAGEVMGTGRGTRAVGVHRTQRGWLPPLCHAAKAMVLAAGVAGWSALAAAGAFPASEQVFPATTRLWCSMPDVHGLSAAFDRTEYGQLTKDPAMKPFVESLRGQIRDAGSQRLARLGLSLEDLETIPGGELAFAAIEPQPGVLATVLLVDTTGHEDQTTAIIERVVARLDEQKATRLPAVAVTAEGAVVHVFQLAADPRDRPDRPRKVAIVQLPHALVVGDHPAVVAQTAGTLAEGRADNLASLPAYQAVAERCGSKVAAGSAPLRWFVDPLGFAKAYQGANPPREKKKGPDYVTILGRQGFDAVRGLGGVALFDDGQYQLRHHTLIYAPPLPGRKPFSPDRFNLAARMLEFPNAASVEPPAWVPREVGSWMALQWDMRAAFRSAESLVDDVVGEKGVFDDVIASLKEDPDGPQIDVESELVNCLGQRVSVVSDYATPIDTDSERLVIAIEATDEESVRKAVAKSMSTDRDMRKVEFEGHVIWEQIDHTDAIPQLEIETPGLARRHADDEDDDSRGRRRVREREEKLLPHSAVTVAKGHLLIASHRDFLERVLATSGDESSLAGSADYTIVAAEVARLFPGSIALRSFGRTDRTVRPAYEMLRRGEMPKSKSLTGQLLNAILGDGKEGSVRRQRIDGSTLPEFETIQRYFGTAGAGMEAVENGWYVAGVALRGPDREPEMARGPVSSVGR